MLLACLIVGLLVSNAFAQPAATGGPDRFGYTWKTNAAPGGPVYNWIDISDGIPITGLADDNFSQPIPLPFKFRYYWLEYDNIFLGSNGYIVFGSANTVPTNVASNAQGFPEFPSTQRGDNFVGMLLADLTFTDSAGAPVPGALAFYKQLNPDTVVVSCINVPYWNGTVRGTNYSGRNNFQIILSRPARTIKIQYGFCSDTSTVHPSYLAPNIRFMTAGMENITGQIGLNFMTNTVPDSGLAIQIEYPDADTFRVRDIAAVWNMTPDNGGVFGFAGQPIELKFNVKNTGTVDLDSDNIQLTANVLKDALSIYTQSVNFPGLRRGIDTVIVPATAFSPAITDTGNYSIRQRLAIPPPARPDQVSSNNSNLTELVVVLLDEDTLPNGKIIERTKLHFDDLIFNPLQGGTDDGAGLRFGVHFPFPYKAVPEYVEADVFNAQNNTQTGLRINIYDGIGGVPGNLRKSITLQPAEIETQSTAIEGFVDQSGLPYTRFRRLRLPTDITDSLDQLYVSCENFNLSGDTIYAQFYAETAAPFSFRTYEINGSFWAPHRQRAGEDYLLRVGIARDANKTVSKEMISNKAIVALAGYPNPAAAEYTIPFHLQQTTNVSVSIFDGTGRQVETQYLSGLGSGEQRIVLPVSGYANGVYSYSLNAGDQTISGKFVVNH